VVAEAGPTAGLTMDVDISEAGDVWGEDGIIIDEGLTSVVLQSFVMICLV